MHSSRKLIQTTATVLVVVRTISLLLNSHCLRSFALPLVESEQLLHSSVVMVDWGVGILRIVSSALMRPHPGTPRASWRTF
jgi:hypothetical protein